MSDKRYAMDTSESNLMHYVATRLVAYMNDRGYDEDDLARKSGVSGSTIRRAVEEQTVPTITTLEALAKGLDRHITDLLPPKAGQKVSDGGGEMATVLVAQRLNRLDGPSLRFLLKHVDEFTQFLIWRSEHGPKDSAFNGRPDARQGTDFMI